MTASHLATVDLGSAVAAVAAARRPLVTGLVGAEAAAAVAACDLAEAIAAAFDPGSPETSRIAGPLVARIGAVTAAPEELRDRADLVVLWFCDPDRTVPGFLDRHVAPSVGGAPRRVVAVGPDTPRGGAAGGRHLPVSREAAIDVARLVEGVIRGIAIDEAAGDAASRTAAHELAAAIGTAQTVAFVTDWSADAVGLAAWSTTSLVRAIAHLMPAFEVPLGERDDPAMAVCTWRYGAAGAIPRADRMHGGFLPAEADATRLIERGEVDCVVVVGDATPAVTAALAGAAHRVAVVQLPAAAELLRELSDRVRGPRGVPA